MEIIRYVKEDGLEPLTEWLQSMRDLQRGQEHPGCRHHESGWLLGRLETKESEAIMKYAASRSHEEATIQELKQNPRMAAEYLNAVLEDGDQEEVMLTLRRITAAFGGVAKLAEQTDLNAKTLYRTLSARGNPEMKNLTAILKAMGMRLAVEPIEPTHA